MFDSTDSSYHSTLFDDDATVDIPVVVHFDLVDIYTSTYEARIIAEDETIPLILYREQDN